MTTPSLGQRWGRRLCGAVVVAVAVMSSVVSGIVSEPRDPTQPFDDPTYVGPLALQDYGLSPQEQSAITAVASNVNNAFVSSITRREFAVLNPDDVVAGCGTSDMLPRAELHITGSSRAHGLQALRHANLPESQSRDYMRTIFIREPEGTILHFLNNEPASRCPARNYGIRARITEVKADDFIITLKYQQYDAGSHVFIDEVSEVRVNRSNFVRVALGFDSVGVGSLVTIICKDYGDPAYVYVGWPHHVPVYRMDEEWSLPVKVVRMTTLKVAGGNTAVVTVLQRPGPPSDKVIDPLTQKPVEGPFLYVGLAEELSQAFGAFSETLEGSVCSLTAFSGNRRPELHCNVDDIQVPEEVLKKAGTARRFKMAAAIASTILAGLAVGMMFRPALRKAAVLPGLLSLGSTGGAIGMKMKEKKHQAEVVRLVKPKVPVDHEHLVFIQADSLPAPSEEENELRKVKLLLDLAEEQRREEEAKGEQQQPSEPVELQAKGEEAVKKEETSDTVEKEDAPPSDDAKSV